jgi:hypothetical protein
MGLKHPNKLKNINIFGAYRVEYLHDVESLPEIP